MPDISHDPSQPQSHRVPEEYRQEDVSQRAARTQRRSSTDHDSLSSILKDIRDLARSRVEPYGLGQRPAMRAPGRPAQASHVRQRLKTNRPRTTPKRCRPSVARVTGADALTPGRSQPSKLRILPSRANRCGSLIRSRLCSPPGQAGQGQLRCR
jgi:hypothetical protein